MFSNSMMLSSRQATDNTDGTMRQLFNNCKIIKDGISFRTKIFDKTENIDD